MAKFKEKKLKRNTRIMMKIDNMSNDDIDALCGYRAIKNMAVTPESLYREEDYAGGDKSKSVEKKKDNSWAMVVIAVVVVVIVCAIWIIALNM